MLPELFLLPDLVEGGFLTYLSQFTVLKKSKIVLKVSNTECQEDAFDTPVVV
jgi:hypothetical protein